MHLAAIVRLRLNPKIILLGLAVAATAAVLWSAPQVLALVREGYPSATLIEPTTHAVVNGAPRPVVTSVASAPSARLSAIFEESGGHALLVLHHGRLIREHYAEDYGPNTRFNSFSMVKSLVGVLVLRAIDEGRLQGLGQKVGTVLREAKGRPVGEVTIGDAMDMTSGLTFEPSAAKAASGVGEKAFEAVPYNPFGPLAKLHAFGVEPLLSGLRFSAAETGVFRYQNVNTALLGAALETVYGADLAAILSQKIWRPAGASDAFWRVYPSSGRATAYCCLYATARDWALVGRYLMRNGDARARFLSDDLWRYWIGKDIPASQRRDGAYRSQARYDVLDRPGEPLLGPFAYFMGQGGQATYLKPDDDLVVVRFGERAQLLHSTLYEALK